MKKSRAMLIAILSLVMVLSFTLAACQPTECTNHVDANSDGICDICGKDLRADCNHVDANHDGICDKCGQTGMEVVHTWDSATGKCSVCGASCEHDFNDKHVCTICGYACTHEFSSEDGVCTICGFQDPSYNPDCYPHDFVNGVCQNCGYGCTNHIYSNGKCVICGHPCEHSWDAATGKCTICNMICDHHFENSTCTICGYTCVNHEYNEGNGQCKICHKECDHTFEDSECTKCHIPCSHNKGADGKCTICGAALTYWVNDSKNYTWRVGPSTLPTAWNYHTYEENSSTYILDYTTDALYAMDYTTDGTAYRIIPSMASGNPIDVTANYVGRYGITQADAALGGKAYKINIKNYLKFDNGEAINANTFVRSVQNLLNPKAANFRADNLWQSGNLKIYGSDLYAKQGSSVYEAVATHYDTISEAIAAGDIYLNKDVLESLFSDWFGGTYAQVKKAGYFKAYFSIYAGEGADRAATSENFFDKWIEPLHSKFVDATEKTDGVSSVKAAFTAAEWQQLIADYANCDDWNPDAESELASMFAVYYTYPEYAYSNVGFFADGDYSIVIVLKQAMEDNFYLRYELCTSFFLVNNDLYEQCISNEGGVYSNNYATSVATYVGYGPYKLTKFQSDSEFTLERNPYWHGYYEPQCAGQYQATALNYKVVSNDELRLQMFLKGELDSYGLRAEDMTDYYSSKYTYFNDSESTWFVALNPDGKTLEANQGKATPVTAGNTVIKTPLTIKEFRQALSYSLDRQLFITTLNPTSSIAKAPLSAMMISDPEAGIFYRTTEEAKDAILEFWGLADEVGPGKLYATKDEAIESITGYDLAGAKVLFNKAYEAAKAAGYITTAMETSGKWELQIMIGSSTWSSAFYSKGYDFLAANWTEAVKGTKFEGHLTFVKSQDLGSSFGNALKNGDVDLLFGVGFSGSMFDPYSFMEVFTGSLAYDAFTDKNNVSVDIEVDGKTVRASLYDWVSKCLQGHDIETVVLDEKGNATSEKLIVNGGTKADASLRLRIMSKCEVAVLELCNMLPLMTDASASMRCMRIQYKTENYILGVGRGGLQYYTFTMSDEEFAAFVAEQGGTLNYKATK